MRREQAAALVFGTAVLTVAVTIIVGVGLCVRSTKRFFERGME